MLNANNAIMELGSGGFDPYGIGDLASDSSSDEDAYIHVEGLNKNLLEDLDIQKRAARELEKSRRRSKINKGKRRPNEPKARHKKKSASRTTSPLLSRAEDYEFEPMEQGSNTRSINQDRVESTTSEDNTPGNTYLQWTSPRMRQRQEEFEAVSRMANTQQDLSPASTSTANAIGRQQEIMKLLSMPHLRDKQVQLQQLLSAETEEEIALIYTKQELERQRQAITQGPLYVQAAFGNIKMQDLAAIDSGATQNFVSKSWLYHYLEHGGKIKVLSFDANGHETFDGTCFYTFGTVEIDVHMQFGTGRDRVLRLVANVTKDSTAMYSIVLGTTFLGMNELFVVDHLKALCLTEDLPEAIRVKSHNVVVNWNMPAKDVYASEDYYLQPGTRILTHAELQDILPRQKKKYKHGHVNSCVADPNKTYAFVPKRGSDSSMVANAMTLVHPKSRVQSEEEQSDDDMSVCSYKTGRAAEEVVDSDQDLDGFEESTPTGVEDSTGEAEAKTTDNASEDLSTQSSNKPTPTGGYNIPIQLANCGDEPVVIRRGTYLGQIHPVEEKSRDVDVQLGGQDAETATGYTEQELDNLIKTLKIEELDIGPEHIANLIKLIRRYANVFAKTSQEVGNVRLMKVGIDVQGHPPIRVKPYRVSPTERDLIKEEVEKMLRAGIIEPSTSAWASPVVLVPKPDGSVRFAIDYRKLNEVTRKETYPMPNIQDYLDVLRGNEYFTIADGQQAYFGLPMDEDSKPLTAFICHLGQYQFLKMPFGLCNAPAIYQRLMSSVLHGMLWEECLVYLDDICLMSATVEDHLERLEKLFKRLTTAGILLKPSKCHLLQRSIKLLGHIIDRDGTRPIGAKVQAIHQFPIRTRGDLHTFLGMTGYYSQYCKNYAEISIPLRKLLHGKGPFTITKEHEIAIMQLKEMLLSEPVLAHPDWDLPFEIHCDASNYAIGVVLCQIIDGKERVIGYYSRLLRDPEKRYDTTQKECLAVVWAVKKLRPYLYGRPFIVKTDHASLKWLLNLKDHNGRLMRWALLLQDYTYVIVHRSGKANANADALSRLIQVSCLESQAPTQDSNTLLTKEEDNSEVSASSIVSAVLRSQANPVFKESRPNPREQEGSRDIPIELDPPATVQFAEGRQVESQDQYPLRQKKGTIFVGDELESQATYDQIADKIHVEQLKDPALQKIMSKFTRDHRQDHITKEGTVYRMKHRLLYLVKLNRSIRGVRTDQEFLVVPKTLQQEIIRLHHDHPTAGHFGVYKTLKRLQQHYTWTNMATMVERYVRSCIPCQRNNLKEVNNAMPKPVMPSGPFDIISMDCLRLPDSVHGNAYVLVMMDYFTKYAHSYVLDGKPSTANTMRALVKFLSQHALVRTIRCDRGSEFTNTCFQEACHQLGIELQEIPTEHHRANGLIERYNRTLQNALCKVLDETVQMNLWEEYIDWVTLAYNTSFQASIQDTPFFMVYGRHAVLPGDLWMYSRARLDDQGEPQDLSVYKRDMIARFAHTYVRAQTHLQKYYDKMILQAARSKKESFEIGEAVWVYQPEAQQRDGIKRKLSYQWHGPMVIAEKHPESDVLYRIYLENRDRRTEGYVHVNRIRKYVGRNVKPADEDVVLPVPSYDIEYADLPLSSTLYDDLTQDTTKAQDLIDDNDPVFDIVQHPKRKPTNAENALIGKVFFIKGIRCKVYRISYHQREKTMVAHYKYQERKNQRWVDTGNSDCSSIPEVTYWIVQSKNALYGEDL